MDLFDNAAATAARDIGMIDAEFAEVLVNPDFGTKAYETIVRAARMKCEVHVDDVLAICEVTPRHPNAWGAVWMRAIKNGVIQRTGRVRPCLSDAGKHKHQYPVYRSGLFYAARRSA